MPVDRDGAREAAEAHFAEQRARYPYAPDVVVVDVEDAGDDWRVFYQARAYVETGDPTHFLFGSWPLLVSKTTADVRSDDSGWEPEVPDGVNVVDLFRAVGREVAPPPEEHT